MHLRLIPLLAVLALIFGCGACSRDGAGAPQRAAADYPPAALNYLSACLETPAAEETAPLGPAWLAIAPLTGLADAPADSPAGKLRALVLKQVAEAQGQPPPELVCAWLACDLNAASRFIGDRLNENDSQYAAALAWLPDAQYLRLRPAGFDLACAHRVLNALPADGAPAAEVPGRLKLLSALAVHGEAAVRLRAIGQLAALQQATPEQLKFVTDTLAGGDLKLIPAACEAVRLSRDPLLADALVPLVAQTKLSAKAEQQVASTSELFGSNALAFLGGDQAQLMRQKLLGAADSTVRWQARLGELLNGDAAPWDAGVSELGIADPDIWVTLATPGIADAALLATFELAARNPQPELRLQAAQHLNQSAGATSETRVVELLSRLVADESPQVQEAAWYTCAQRSRHASGTYSALNAQAATVLADAGAEPAVRLAAASCLLNTAAAP